MTSGLLPDKHRSIHLIVFFLLAFQFIENAPLEKMYSSSAISVESNKTTVINITTAKLNGRTVATVTTNLSNATITKRRKTTMESATKATNATDRDHAQPQYIGYPPNNSSDIDPNIVIQMSLHRGDRLGSNIRRPLYLMGYSNCYRQTFCIVKGREGLTKYFHGFDSCPGDLHTRLDRGDREWVNEKPMFEDRIEKPGVYPFKNQDKSLEYWHHDHEDCSFDDDMRRKWGQMIVDASYSDWIKNRTLAEEELFEKSDDPNVVTLAVNIRRGDFFDWGRQLVPDQVYVVMLRQLRSILKKAGKSPEVHLFSEDYGLINEELNITRNWTMYDGLVEHFHLVGDMRTEKNKHVMNMDLNLRDWRHFVKADILVVGGSFSYIPSLGRPKHPDPTTGLPLTIDIWTSPDKNKSKTKYQSAWSSGKLPDKYKLVNLPEVFAKHDTIPVEVFFEDLVADFRANYRALPNYGRKIKKQNIIEPPRTNLSSTAITDKNSELVYTENNLLAAGE